MFDLKAVYSNMM